MNPNDGISRSILYIFDSLRSDRLNCYGYDNEITSNIDTIADDGVRFQNAFSQAIWTYPSAATIFSGLYPETHGSQQVREPLDPNLPHLTDELGDDVTTACFSTTLGVSPDRGFKQGFDEFYHIGTGRTALRPDIMDLLNDQLLPWVEEHADESFFLVVWAMGTHHPFLTPEIADNPTEPATSAADKGAADWLGQQSIEQSATISELYDHAIKYSDKKLGELLQVLKNNGVYDETTIIVTSDHGEIFDEHARLEHAPAWIQSLCRKLLGEERSRRLSLFEKSAWAGHQAIYPYDELIHVPLLLKPGIKDINDELCGAMVELVDILPTVAMTFGVDIPPACQGNSLYEYLSGGVSKDHVYSTSQIHNGNVSYSSIRSKSYKLCVQEWELPDIATMPMRRIVESSLLYLLNSNKICLEVDSKETKIANKLIDEELSERLSKHKANCRALTEKIRDSADSITIDEETEKRLEELGYK